MCTKWRGILTFITPGLTPQVSTTRCPDLFEIDETELCNVTLTIRYITFVEIWEQWHHKLHANRL